MFYKDIHHFLTYSLTESPFSSKSSKHWYSQTIRTSELKFFENCHFAITCHVSPVMCLVSCVMCPVSSVTCHLIQNIITPKKLTFWEIFHPPPGVTYPFIWILPNKLVKLVKGRYVINKAYSVQFLTSSQITPGTSWSMLSCRIQYVFRDIKQVY